MDKFSSTGFLRKIRSRSTALAKVRQRVADAVAAECKYPFAHHAGTSVTVQRFTEHWKNFLVITALSHIALHDEHGTFVELSSIAGNFFAGESVDEVRAKDFWKTGWNSITKVSAERTKTIVEQWMEDPRRLVAKKGRKKRA